MCCPNQRSCLQLHGEALLKEGVRVAPAAAEADHGVLLVGLVLLATDQALVPQVRLRKSRRVGESEQSEQSGRRLPHGDKRLVGLEVGQPDDDALRIHRCGQGGNAFRDFLDVEVLATCIAAITQPGATPIDHSFKSFSVTSARGPWVHHSHACARRSNPWSQHPRCRSSRAPRATANWHAASDNTTQQKHQPRLGSE